MLTPGTHPVLARARSVRAALVDVADLDLTFMPSRDQTEAELVRQAPDFFPAGLARPARHIEAVIDPGGADEAEGHHPRGCRSAGQVDGCDVPATWCDAHHEDPWSRGGRTDLKNALLVCGHHHRRLHDSRYSSARSGDRVALCLRR